MTQVYETGFRKAEATDDESLKNLMNVPMQTRGIWLSFEREPSFFNGQQIIATDPMSVVYELDGELAAAFSNGKRPCYVNGELKNLGYACDMRISLKARGSKLMSVSYAELLRQLRSSELDYTQNIVLKGNQAALVAVRSNKPEDAPYVPIDPMHTLTLTGFRAKALNPHLSIRTATPEDVPAMNLLATRMGQFYQMLPHYDFSKLGTDDPYYLGLSITDFVLCFDDEQLVGLVGVWDQEQIKQTRVVKYDKKIALIRPFYNLIAPYFKLVPLPKSGECFNYRILHSLFCEPDRLDVCDALVREAFKKARLSGSDAVTFTLAQSDPRYTLMSGYAGEKLVGMYGLYLGGADPRPGFNPKLVHYAECGRI
jgi:hypothetical protein